MSFDLKEQEKALRSQIDRSEAELVRLEAELDAVNDGLSTLAEKSPQFDALVRVCDSLEELEAAGAESLFWGDDRDAEDAAARVVDARGRIDNYFGEVQLLSLIHI